MNRARVLLAVFLASLLMLPALSAAAQDEESNEFDFADLEGIEAGVGRTWSVDFDALMAQSTPSEDFDIFAGADGLLFLFGWVLEFDDDGHAEDAFDLFREEGAGIILTDMDDTEDVTTEEEELDDIGDQGYAIDLVSTAEGDEGYFRYTFSQQDEYVFFSISLSTNGDDIEAADDLLDHLVNDGEKSGDDAEFNEDGGSTGGLWGYFPDDDDVPDGLIPAGDQILYPVPEEEE